TPQLHPRTPISRGNTPQLHPGAPISRVVTLHNCTLEPQYLGGNTPQLHPRTPISRVVTLHNCTKEPQYLGVTLHNCTLEPQYLYMHTERTIQYLRAAICSVYPQPLNTPGLRADPASLL
ncbi:hypothetical protein LEMLEM_LOCUS6603, partial [Lemmus lemmus]